MLRTAIDEALSAADDEWTVAELSELVLGDRAVFLPDGLDLDRVTDALEEAGCLGGIPSEHHQYIAAAVRLALLRSSPEPRP